MMTMYASLRPLMLLFAALALFATACASTPEIPSKPLPPGINLSGKWYSPQYENMTLEHKGGKVIGSFSYKTGGVLEGELKDNILFFDWEQPGDFSIGRRHVGGRGYFIISDDGNNLEGRWGYEDEMESGGVWEAERLIDNKDEIQDGPIFGQ